jgi:SanA protein
LKFYKKILLLFFAAILSGVGLIMICNYVIIKKSYPYIYENAKKLPFNKAGLILGTSKNFRGGAPNLYFDNRIKAAVELYRSKRIKYIIVSGDNRKASYNEPVMMKKELVKSGVPDSSIFLDYAGFRTFDSVIRCREIFSQSSITIISQRFHLERAIYISHYFGIGAIGFEAQDVSWSQGFKTNIREYFARVKVFWDLHTGEKPKFLGKKIIIK